jgi:hypothetical protein
MRVIQHRKAAQQGHPGISRRDGVLPRRHHRAERLRAAVFATAEQARWAPGATAETWQWTARAAAVTGHASELVLRSLVGHPGQPANPVLDRAQLQAAADAVAESWAAWRHLGVTWNGLTTDTRGQASPVVAEIGDLMLRMGRLAWDDPQWIPTTGHMASPRPAAQLMTDGDGVNPCSGRHPPSHRRTCRRREHGPPGSGNRRPRHPALRADPHPAPAEVRRAPPLCHRTGRPGTTTTGCLHGGGPSQQQGGRRTRHPGRRGRGTKQHTGPGQGSLQLSPQPGHTTSPNPRDSHATGRRNPAHTIHSRAGRAHRKGPALR